MNKDIEFLEKLTIISVARQKYFPKEKLQFSFSEGQIYIRYGGCIYAGNCLHDCIQTIKEDFANQLADHFIKNDGYMEKPQQEEKK